MTPLRSLRPSRCVVGLLFSSVIAAQAPTLIADLETQPRVGSLSSQPRDFTVNGSAALFVATRPDVGEELWITTGQSGATRLVADLWPGPESSSPGGLTPFQNGWVFVAGSYTVGFFLWFTDGKPGGTRRLSQGGAYARGAYPRVAVAGGQIFFVLDDYITGQELWVSDGTRAGTRLVLDIEPGPNSSVPQHLTAVGSHVFFSASTSGGGVEPWVSDGTSAGTRMLRDIVPGIGGSFPVEFTALSATDVVFAADDPNAGFELWRSDGTSPGTQRVMDIRPGSTGSFPQGLRAIGSEVWFAANDGASGSEPWRTDGTVAGTRRVADVRPGGSGSGAGGFVAFAGRVWFTADDGVNGFEVRSSDGTAAGTTMLADVWPGGGSSYPGELTAGAGMLFFRASTGVGSALWKTDGTGAGTKPVLRATILTDPHGLVEFGGEVLFRGRDPLTGDLEPWSTRGTVATTRPLADLASLPAGATLGSLVWPLAQLGDSVLFVTYDNMQTTTVWRADGRGAGTTMLFQVSSNWVTPFPDFAVRVGARTFMGFGDGTFLDLWVTDGTSAGSRQVVTLPWAINYLPGRAAAFRDRLFFVAGGSGGSELWVSDGTAAGTQLFLDLWPGSLGSEPAWLTVHRDRLLFAADDGVTGAELWATDGTVTGTVRVRDIAPGVTGSRPQNLITHDGEVYFTADDGSAGNELWRTDGTAAGTSLVADIAPGFASSGATPGVSTDAGLFVVADDGSHGFEPWITDGTAAGTRLVVDLAPGPESMLFGLIGEADGRALISCFDDGVGLGLWSTDGTAAGTVELPMRTDYFAFARPWGERQAFLSAFDDAFGLELWRTDGTPAGSAPVADLAPGASSSSPSLLGFAGDALLVVADDGVFGREPWRIVVGAVSRSLGGGCAAVGVSPPVLRGSVPRLGTVAQLEVRGAPVGSAGFLLVGPPLATAVPLGGGCDLLFDATRSTVLVGAVMAQPTWTVAVPVPNLPGLRGLTVAVQGGFGPTAAAAGMDLSNGLAWSLGD